MLIEIDTNYKRPLGSTMRLHSGTGIRNSIHVTLKELRRSNGDRHKYIAIAEVEEKDIEQVKIYSEGTPYVRIIKEKEEPSIEERIKDLKENGEEQIVEWLEELIRSRETLTELRDSLEDVYEKVQLKDRM